MKINSKLTILLILVTLTIVSCFRIDKPEITSDKQTVTISDKPVESEYKELRTKTINGTDYILSRGNDGEFGGNFVTSTIGEGPKTFNPWTSKDATSSAIADLMFDSLVTTDSYTGQVTPKLAKTIKVSKDNKTYAVELRHGLQWSDGKPITADDVVFTWNKIILGGFGNTSTRDSVLIDNIPPTITKIDNYTVQFKTIKPFAPFLRLLSVPIAPKHIIEPILAKGKRFFDSYWGTTTKASDFITNGPFMLSEYVPAQRVVLKRNPNYYVIDSKERKLPYLDKYIFLIVGDLNNQLLKFESKEIDTIGLSGKDVARFKEQENKSDYIVYNLGPDTGTMFLTFNMNQRKNEKGKYYVNPKKQKWFNDINFRKAVDYALDRDNIVFNIANGVGQPLFTAEALPSIYLNKKLETGHSRDLNYAKKILIDAGYKYDSKGILHDKVGNTVEFDLITNAGNTEREAIGVMVKQDLQDLGIKVNFKPIEFNSLVNKITTTLDWDSVIIGLTGNALEPHSGKNVWYSDGSLHMFDKRNENEKNPQIRPWEKQVDDIFDQAALKLNFGERKKLYDKYQQIIYDERPIIYIYSPLRIIAIRKKFGNIFPTQLGGLTHNPEEIYIKDEKTK